jgi:hypothetical protein
MLGLSAVTSVHGDVALISPELEVHRLMFFFFSIHCVQSAALCLHRHWVQELQLPFLKLVDWKFKQGQNSTCKWACM